MKVDISHSLSFKESTKQIITAPRITILRMKILVIIAAIEVSTHARSLSKRQAFQSCFPFCGMEVPSGGVSQSCVGGNCAQSNAEGATASQSCHGAECNQINAEGASASQSCDGGDCGQDNDGGAVAIQSCQGAECNQNNAEGASASQNCEGSNCGQNNAGGATA